MSGDAAITTTITTTVATTTMTTRTTTTNTDDFYANATSKCCCCFTFLLLLLLLSSGVWGPARPLLLQQNNKCGSATRAVACPCMCVCVWRNENWIRLLPPSSLSVSLLCSSSAVRFGLVWLVYCGRLAGGVGQAGDTMEPLSVSLSLSLAHKLWLLPNLILAPFQASSCCCCCRRCWCERVITLIIIIYERWQYKSGETQSDGYPD